MYKYLDILTFVLIFIHFSDEIRLIALSFNRLRRCPLEAKFQDRTLVGQLNFKYMKEWWYKIRNFFRNLYIYRKILSADYQFDYGYLLDLEKFKLQLMLKSFKDESHTDHTNDIRWISICIKLIDIIQEEDSALEVVEMEMSKPQFKLIKYVNINNAFRFGIEYLDRYDGLQVYRRELLRQQKALYLYNKIRYNYMLEWWD